MTQRVSSRAAGQVAGTTFGILFGLVWVLGWSAVTLTFDVIWVKAVAGQLRARSYPTAAGRIVSSRVHESRNSESTSYTPKVRYAYDVGGRRYDCDRYRYETTSSGRRRAKAVVASYPAGRPVTVHYNPSNPSDAVLRPGLEAGDLFMPLFMMPFNLIMLASWLVAVLILIEWLIKPRPAGVKVRHDGMSVRVRPDAWLPLAAAAVAAWVAAFVCIFPVACAGGSDAPPAVIFAAWGVVLAAAVLVYFRTALPQWAGHRDLVIDPWRKTITLPRTHGRHESVQLQLSDVTAVEVEHRENMDGEGGVSHAYLPTLKWKDSRGVQHSDVLASWNDSDRADRFAAWLRERAGLKPHTAT